MDFQTYAVRELTAVGEKLADTAKKQLEAATAQMTANFETTIGRLRTDQTQLLNENERLHAENAALTWEKAEMLETAKAAARGPLIDRLAEVFERVANSKSVDDALLTVGEGLVGDFARVAVFAGDRQLAQLGEPAPAIDRLSSSLARWPLVVRGETVATIVAADETRPGEGSKLAEVLQRHLLLALERLTVELKTVGELRAYAKMLLDEVEYVFNADTTAHVSATERRERLTENLRCARQIYGQRVTLEGPAASSVLDEVLSEMLDTKGDTAFGKELADVATAPSESRN